MFNAWLDSRLRANQAAGLMPGLLLFPEGTRSTLDRPVPLKRGMVAFAHSRGLPVQLVISRGKEEVIAEKRWAARRGVTLVTGFSRLLQPTEAPSCEAFIDTVEREWAALWDRVYGAQASSAELPVLQPRPPLYDFPMSMRVQQLLVCLSSVGLLLAIAWLALLHIKLLLPLAGPILAAGLLMPRAGSSSSPTVQHSTASAIVVPSVKSAAQISQAAGKDDSILSSRSSSAAIASWGTTPHNHEG